MKVKTRFIHFCRKLRSIVVLCLTISLLFYYTFQNEIDILNSYAENEYLPTINIHTNTPPPLTDSTLDTNIPTTPNNNIPNIHDPQVNLDDKNKYFPLLITSPRQDPSLTYKSDIHKDHNPLIFKEKYPVLFEVSLPLDTSGKLGPQFPHILEEPNIKMINRIRSIFMKSWKQQFAQWQNDPWPIGLIDSLDTLWLLNETSTFYDSIELLSKIDMKLPYTINDIINMPDLVGRGLGGLISSYELSKDDRLLTKSKQLGDFILRSFDTPNRLPIIEFPWRSPYNNRFPYRTTNVGGMMKMCLEMTKLTQLTQDNKYFDAIYHILTYIWETSTELPVKSLFPNVVDASGCKLLTDDELSKGTHQNNQMMKSINEDLTFVYCHQLKHFTGLGSRVDLEDKDYLTIYDSLSQLFSLINVDALHSMQPQVISNIETSEITGVEDSDITRRDLSSIDKKSEDSILSYDKIIDSAHIFHEAMDNIINLMTFKPSTPLNLTLLSSLDTNALYSPTTNELEVQLRRDFKFHPESCQLVATLIYGDKIFSTKNDKYMNVANDLIESCLQLSKQYHGIMNTISLDWGDNYELGQSNSVGLDDDLLHVTNLPFDENRKLENVLNGRYVGFDKSFTIHNEIFASKVKQSNLNSEEWKRSYSYLHNEQFLNIKLNEDDIDLDTKSWNPSYHLQSNEPLWINAIDDNKQTLLSPFVVKGLLYLYRNTGDPKWRALGEELFEMTMTSIEELNMRPKGFWKISEVNQENIPSHWFSQTLKYYYLLFEDSTKFSFNDYVFTNNGHLLARTKIINKSNKDLKKSKP